AFSTIAECATVPVDVSTCIWNSPGPPTTSGRIRVSSGSPAVSLAGTSPPFTITSTPGGSLPDGWLQADVGAVSADGGGSADAPALDGASFTVRGSGRDIWGLADSFHFVWKNVTGDFSIDVHIDSLAITNAWAKAGLMVRANAT